MDLLSPRAKTLDLRSALASDVSSSWPSTSSEIPLTDDVTVLLLDDNGLEHLLTPKLPPLDTLSLSSNKLTSLEPDVATLASLRVLRLDFNRLKALPQLHLPALEELWLAGNALTALPHSIGGCAALRELYVEDNALASLPPTVGALANLQRLDASRNALRELPPSCVQLSSLTHALLRDNELGAFPWALAHLPALEEVDVRGNAISHLPPRLACCASLGQLRVDADNLAPPLDAIARQGRLPLLSALHALHARRPVALGLARPRRRAKTAAHVRATVGPPGPTATPHPPTAVTLCVYDLAESNAWTAPIGVGIFHCAVHCELTGLEYNFAAIPDGPDGDGVERVSAGSGVFRCARGGASRWMPVRLRETHELGATRLARADLALLLDELADAYPASSYHMVARNCNSFCAEFVGRLLGTALPAYVDRPAAWARMGSQAVQAVQAATAAAAATAEAPMPALAGAAAATADVAANAAAATAAYASTAAATVGTILDRAEAFLADVEGDDGGDGGDGAYQSERASPRHYPGYPGGEPRWGGGGAARALPVDADEADPPPRRAEPGGGGGVFPLPPSLKSLVDDFSAALPFSLVEPPPEEAPRSWRDPVAPPA